MSKNIYNEFQIKELEKNPNISSVSYRSISYSLEFKMKAVTEYKSGKTPSQIFIEHGFDLEMIGKGQPKRCLKRRRDTFRKFGEEGFSLRNVVAKGVQDDHPFKRAFCRR